MGWECCCGPIGPSQQHGKQEFPHPMKYEICITTTKGLSISLIGLNWEAAAGKHMFDSMYYHVPTLFSAYI
jgi:hypothetical protein